MHTILCFFKNHPEWGMATSLSAVVQTFIDTSTPVLQYMGLVIGVLIGVLTLYARIRDIRQHGKK